MVRDRLEKYVEAGSDVKKKKKAFKVPRYNEATGKKLLTKEEEEKLMDAQNRIGDIDPKRK